MLYCAGLWLVIDVLGPPVGPIFKVQAVLTHGTIDFLVSMVTLVIKATNVAIITIATILANISSAHWCGYVGAPDLLCCLH